MRPSVARIKGLGFIFWHAKHEFFHVLLGLIWAWFLRERWGEFNVRWIGLSILGSLLPDIDHFFYFFTYGKMDAYTVQVRSLFKNKQWRALTSFIESGHKHNTNLASHNFYFMGILFLVALLSSFFSWEAGVILFGAMLIHYFFDIADDLLRLGKVNSNWKRWGRAKLAQPEAE